MGVSHWNMAAVAAVVTLCSCVGLPWKQSVGAEPPRIVDGSTVTFFFQITVPGEYGLDVHQLGQFVQGRHQLLPALERKVIGMKAGDEKKVQLSAEESFGPYDTKKRKTVSEERPARRDKGRR